MARGRGLLAGAAVVRAVKAILVEDTVEGLVGRRGRGARLARGGRLAGRWTLVGLTLLLLVGSNAVLGGTSHGERRLMVLWEWSGAYARNWSVRCSCKWSPPFMKRTALVRSSHDGMPLGSGGGGGGWWKDSGVVKQGWRCVGWWRWVEVEELGGSGRKKGGLWMEEKGV
jgi:hypothetical protein